MEWILGNAANLTFYTLALVLILGALAMISVKNPVYSVLFLMVCFFASSAIWLSLYAEFLALALILVYVGAVMVLLLFVVMMVDIKQFDSVRLGRNRYIWVASLVGLLLFLTLSSVFYQQLGSHKLANMVLEKNTLVQTSSNARQLGQLIFKDYLYAFEVVGVVLLLAIVASVALTLTGERKRKIQDVAHQLSARKQDRLQVVRIPNASESLSQPSEPSSLADGAQDER